MSKIMDFIKKCKLPFLWTVCYIFVLWATLHILFNFELFSSTNWIRVSHAHLRGLGGFAFSLIILTAIPLYIATLTIVIRTQKPLLALPVPRFVSKIMEKLFPKQTTLSDSETTEEKIESVCTTPTNEELDSIPAEMRAVFIRAKTRPNRINAPICNVCTINPNVYPTAQCDDKSPIPITQPVTTTQNTSDTPTMPEMPNENDLPLPPDFDFGSDFDMTSTPLAPVFRDISFDDDDTAPVPKQTTNDKQNPVTKYLTKTNRKFTTSGNDIIITDNAAIAVHDDPDFWIMDDPVWFASGKTRESPTTELLNLAKEHNISAVLYLGATNIMNFENKRKEWEAAGIHVVTELSDL